MKDFLIIISSLFFILLLIVGYNLRGVSASQQDQWIKDFFYQIPYPKLYQWMRKFTVMANAETILIISIPLFYMLHSDGKVVEMSAIIISTGLATIITHTLKYIFRRIRPKIPVTRRYLGYSFPSGHSASGMAFYLVLAYVLTAEYKIFYIAIILAFILALAIALSRVVLGVHWFTDVLFGLFLGLNSAIWGIYCYEIGFYFKFLIDKM